MNQCYDDDVPDKSENNLTKKNMIFILKQKKIKLMIKSSAIEGMPKN